MRSRICEGAGVGEGARTDASGRQAEHRILSEVGRGGGEREWCALCIVLRLGGAVGLGVRGWRSPDGQLPEGAKQPDQEELAGDLQRCLCNITDYRLIPGADPQCVL